ncbi:uncharacterized protein LOC119402307 [Rhipicephalus sanguineus]|uniref:uncharacterized protein LOC119402307 n=1 Tax=Rhipicephalus sanguineus TaxID=34632 RepID=UPI0020C56394|nr:uncharacterized protein LOC119402307 [Rhipicephalus sanguineus]
MMAAAEVHKHFHRECEYHYTSCPRCSVMVLCRDVGEHLRASCNAIAAPQATDCEGKPGDAVVTEILEGVRKVVLEQAGEMKALLERSFGENSPLNDCLSEVSRSVNSLKESVSQGIAPVEDISQMTRRVLDGINTIHGSLRSEMADIKQQNEELPRVRAAIESAKEDAAASTKRVADMQKKALAYAEKNQTRCSFFVPRIESLEEKALKDGESEYVHGQVYLRGYNISPGVLLVKSGESVLLKMRLKLNKGEHDDEIPWPFEHKIRFAILHPDKNEDKTFIHKSCRSFTTYHKEHRRNKVAWVTAFNLGDLKRDGYVYNDMLRVTWELL